MPKKIVKIDNSGLDKAHKIVDIASDKQAADIVLLDSRGVCSFADYFVMASVDSDRQLKAISEEVVHSLKLDGVQPLHREGKPDSGWVLIDYGDVVVHIFAEPERELYNLDELWREAKPVIRIA
jgi:ribosome-associated protein